MCRRTDTTPDYTCPSVVSRQITVTGAVVRGHMINSSSRPRNPPGSAGPSDRGERQRHRSARGHQDVFHPVDRVETTAVGTNGTSPTPTPTPVRSRSVARASHRVVTPCKALDTPCPARRWQPRSLRTLLVDPLTGCSVRARSAPPCLEDLSGELKSGCPVPASRPARPVDMDHRHGPAESGGRLVAGGGLAIPERGDQDVQAEHEHPDGEDDLDPGDEAG